MGQIKNMSTYACIDLPMTVEEYSAKQYQDDDHFLFVSKKNQLKIHKVIEPTEVEPPLNISSGA